MKLNIKRRSFLRGLGGVTLGPAVPRDLRAAHGGRADGGDAEAAGRVLQLQRRQHAELVPDHDLRRADAGVVHGHRAGADRLVRAEDPAAARPAPGAARLRPRSERRRRPRARRRLQADRGAAGRHDREIRDRRLDRPGDRQGGQPGRQGRAEPDGRLPQQGRARLHLVRRGRAAGEPVPGPVEGVQGLDRYRRHGRDRRRQAGDAAQERHRRVQAAVRRAEQAPRAVVAGQAEAGSVRVVDPHDREHGDDDRACRSAACPTRAAPRSWRSTRRTSRATASTRRSAA